MRPKNAKKKTKTSTGSVRYLLSGDRKLQRLSLKKMRAGTKKRPDGARKSKVARTRAPRPPVAAPGPDRLAWMTESRAFIIGGICVVGAAVVIGAGYPSEIANSPTTIAPHGAEGRSFQEAPFAARLHARAAADAGAPVAVAATLTPRLEDPVRMAAAVEPARTPVVESRPKAPAAPAPKEAEAPAPTAPAVTPRPAAASAPPAVEEGPTPTGAAAAAAGADVAPVTITGCLVLDDQTFWLKDTSGDEAPKSRNWRSGFLRKRASPVALVDVSGTLALSSHVGQRVAATGPLVNRELRLRSLQRVAISCS